LRTALLTPGHVILVTEKCEKLNLLGWLKQQPGWRISEELLRAVTAQILSVRDCAPSRASAARRHELTRAHCPLPPVGRAAHAQLRDDPPRYQGALLAVHVE
jgi:hypothetical protein